MGLDPILDQPVASHPLCTDGARSQVRLAELSYQSAADFKLIIEPNKIRTIHLTWGVHCSPLLSTKVCPELSWPAKVCTDFAKPRRILRSESLPRFRSNPGSLRGFSCSTSGKNPPASGGDIRGHRFSPWVGKIPWRNGRQPTPDHRVAKSWIDRSELARGVFRTNW